MTTTKRKTAHTRGYGSTHQKQREQLLRSLHDGTPCWWCTRPMHRNPERNWDRQPLHADHTTTISHGGTAADRLMCATCNKQRGNGDWDDYRPAVTGIPPERWSKTTIKTTTTHYRPTLIDFT